VKVILRSDVDGVGKKGDICDVATGYGRNFLIPKGLALVASKGAEKQADSMRRSRDVKDAAARSAAQEVASTLVRRVDSARFAFSHAGINLLKQIQRINMGRRGYPAPDNVHLLATVIGMVKIGIAPATRAQRSVVFGMGIDDGVFFHFVTDVRYSAFSILGAGKVKQLELPPNQGREMRENRNLLIVVGVIRDGCTVEKHDVAKVHTEVLEQDAPYDAVTGAQSLYPYRLFQTRVIRFRGSFRQWTFGEFDLALRITTVRQIKAAHFDLLAHA
jgi:hypothetical protein